MAAFCEDYVAEVMAVGIVHGLEMVEIEEDHGERFARAFGCRNLALQRIPQEAPVVEAGQRIGQRQSCLLFERLEKGFSARHTLQHGSVGETFARLREKRQMLHDHETGLIDDRDHLPPSEGFSPTLRQCIELERRQQGFDQIEPAGQLFGYAL
jgi:hypothetical protein